MDADSDKLYIGVGRGLFDEHRGVQDECAAGLVWAAFRDQMSLDEATRDAVIRIVDWVRLEDTGRTKGEAHHAFSIPSILGGFAALGNDDTHLVKFGGQLLDSVLVGQIDLSSLLLDWKNRREFDTPYGRTALVVTHAERADDYGYEQGFDVVISMSPDNKRLAIKARPENPVKFDVAMDKLRAADPDAGWFYHHSGHMILVGGTHGQGAAPTRLTPEEIITCLQ